MTQSTMLLRFAVSVILCAALAEFTSAQPAKVAEVWTWTRENGVSQIYRIQVFDDGSFGKKEPVFDPGHCPHYQIRGLWAEPDRILFSGQCDVNIVEKKNLGAVFYDSNKHFGYVPNWTYTNSAAIRGLAYDVYPSAEKT